MKHSSLKKLHFNCYRYTLRIIYREYIRHALMMLYLIQVKYTHYTCINQFD